jgi:hypothetical protein
MPDQSAGNTEKLVLYKSFNPLWIKFSKADSTAVDLHFLRVLLEA